MTINNCVFGGSVTNIGAATLNSPGREFINFTLLVQPSGHNKDGSEREALFIRCVAFGHSAKFAADYMQKSQKAVVTGSLEKRRYTDKNGIEKESYQLKVQSLQLIKDTAPAREPEQSQVEPAQGIVQESYRPDSIPDAPADEEIVIPGEFNF